MGYIYFPQFKKGREGIKIHPGLTILDYIRKANIEIDAECGGYILNPHPYQRGFPNINHHQNLPNPLGILSPPFLHLPVSEIWIKPEIWI